MINPNKEQLLIKQQQALDYLPSVQKDKAALIYINLIEDGVKSYIVYGNLASIYSKDKKFKEALSLLEKAISIKPEYFDGHYNRGLIFTIKKDYLSAIKCFSKCLNLQNNNLYVLKQIASCYYRLDKYKKATSFCKVFISKNINDPEIYYLLSICQIKIGDIKDAKESAKKALSIRSDFIEAYAHIGKIYFEESDFKSAAKYYNKIIEIDKNYPDSYYNLSLALLNHGDYLYAKKISNEGLNYNPNDLKLLNNLAASYFNIGNIDDALNIYHRIIKLKCNDHNTLYNLGTCLQRLGDYYEALRYYFKSIKQSPNQPKVKAKIIFCQRMICDWSTLELHQKWLNELSEVDNATSPWSLLAMDNDPSKQLIRAKNYYQKKYHRKPYNTSIVINEKIRIGYFSSDYFNHATMTLIHRLFELHDKNKFDIYIYDYGFNKTDKYLNFFSKNGCIYREISNLNDNQVFELVIKDKINISIDLKGYTQGNRFSLFAYRLSPIQISFLGYPESTGASCMDYLIADRYIITTNYKKINLKKQFISMDHINVIVILGVYQPKLI